MSTKDDQQPSIAALEARISKLEKNLKNSFGVALIAALFFSIVF